MATPKFSRSEAGLKDDILTAIDEATDPNMRTIMVFLAKMFDDLSTKIDSVLSNEAAMRQMVLNGHADKHHAHHEWVAKKISDEADGAASRRRVTDGVITQLVTTTIKGLIWAVLLGLVVYLSAAQVMQRAVDLAISIQQVR